MTCGQRAARQPVIVAYALTGGLVPFGGLAPPGGNEPFGGCPPLGGLASLGSFAPLGGFAPAGGGPPLGGWPLVDACVARPETFAAWPAWLERLSCDATASAAPAAEALSASAAVTIAALDRTPDRVCLDLVCMWFDSLLVWVVWSQPKSGASKIYKSSALLS